MGLAVVCATGCAGTQDLFAQHLSLGGFWQRQKSRIIRSANSWVRICKSGGALFSSFSLGF
jgi:hypothetical protein